MNQHAQNAISEVVNALMAKHFNGVRAQIPRNALFATLSKNHDVQQQEPTAIDQYVQRLYTQEGWLVEVTRDSYIVEVKH